MSNTSLNIEATGELVSVLGGTTHTYRFENTDPANPIVAMISVQGESGVDAMTTIPSARMRVSMQPDDGPLSFDPDQLLAKTEGVANWAKALLELVENTDCNPDDPDEFNEVLMGASMFLTAYREFVKK